MMEINFTQLATVVGQALQKKALKLTIAESCTGGLASHAMTSIPESSSWFERGFITYSNESKQEMLDVSPNTIEQFGFVSEKTAKEMAEGALKHSHADISLSITGIAGPSGGTSQTPVGTVCFAWSNRRLQTKTVMKNFSGDRISICKQAVEFALQGLLEYLKQTLVRSF